MPSLDRVPPHSQEAEVGVLGAILLDHEAVMSMCVDEQVVPECFYIQAHRIIFEAILELSRKGSPIDLLTVPEQLKQGGMLERIGGYATLEHIADQCIVAHAQYYIEIVKQKYHLRGIIEVGREAERAAYTQDSSPMEIASVMMTGAMKLSDTGRSLTGNDACWARHRELRRMAKEKGSQGLTSKWPFWDHIFGGYVSPHNIIIAAKTSHGKTSFALNEILPWAAKGVPVAIAEPDMSEYDLRERCAQIISGSNTQKFKGPRWTTEDEALIDTGWDALGHLPIYINDKRMTCEETIMWFTVMVKRYGCQLVVLDFLQKLKRTEREYRLPFPQVVGDWSAMISEAGKRLNVPTVVMSQFSRFGRKEDDPTTPPAPTLESLKECLAVKSTKLLTPFGYQCNTTCNIQVVSLSKEGTAYMDSENIPKKTGKTWRVRLMSGRFIEATATHKILKDTGMTPVCKLKVGDSIATVRRIPEPKGVLEVREARWIGWMLGNGSMYKYACPTFSCSDEVLAKEFIRATDNIFGMTPKPTKCLAGKWWQYRISKNHPSEINAVREYCYSHDLWGRRSEEKVIPQWFMETADNESIAELIGGLWDTDGSVVVCKSRTAYLSYSSASLEMCNQVMWGLSRLGVYSRVDDGYQRKKRVFVNGREVRSLRKCYRVFVTGPEINLFRRLIRLTGKKGALLSGISVSHKENNHVDRLGVWVGTELVKRARESGVTLGYRDQGRRISQSFLARFLPEIGNPPDLAWLVNPDVAWDKITSITYVGVQAVFDRCVPGLHNYCANGIIVSNSGSIEQNADKVVLISQRPGVPKSLYEYPQVVWDMDVNLAKNRCGVTGVKPFSFHVTTQRLIGRNEGDKLRRELAKPRELEPHEQEES